MRQPTFAIVLSNLDGVKRKESVVMQLLALKSMDLVESELAAYSRSMM